MIQFTILENQNGIACKTFSADGVKPFDTDQLRVTQTQVTSTDLHDFHDILAEMVHHRTLYLIRGLSIYDTQDIKLRRGESSDTPYFYDEATTLLCIDIDGVQTPYGMNLLNGVKYVKSLLPQGLCNADCVYQLSNSAGYKGNKSVNVHLFFELDTPITCESLREWHKQLTKTQKIHGNNKLIDAAMFKSVQPCYTANPLYTGIVDPIGETNRVGFIGSSNRKATLIKNEVPPAQQSKSILPVYVGKQKKVDHFKLFDWYLKHLRSSDERHIVILSAYSAYKSACLAAGQPENASYAIDEVRAACRHNAGIMRDSGTYMCSQYHSNQYRTAKPTISNRKG